MAKRERVSRSERLFIKAVEDEPELPGDMPDDMWAAISTNREALTLCLQAVVSETKKGIIERYRAAIAADRKRRKK